MKTQILKQLQAIEAEYDQPFAEVVTGYRDDGISLSMTADILGLSRSALSAMCAQLEIVFGRRKGPGRGEHTDERRQAIARGRRQGNIQRIEFLGRPVTYSELAEQFNLSRQVVRYRAQAGYRDQDLVRPHHLTATQKELTR